MIPWLAVTRLGPMSTRRLFQTSRLHLRQKQILKDCDKLLVCMSQDKWEQSPAKHTDASIPPTSMSLTSSLSRPLLRPGFSSRC